MPANLMWCSGYSGESERGKFGEQPPMSSCGLGTPHRTRTLVNTGRSLTRLYLCNCHVGSESSSLFSVRRIVCTLHSFMNMSKESKLLTSEAMISFMAYRRHITLNSVGLYLSQIFIQVVMNMNIFICHSKLVHPNF